MFRAARASDFDGVMRLCRQLHPEDPSTHAFYKACGFSADIKTAYVVLRHETDGR